MATSTINAIPAMTSNTAPSGTASASSIYTTTYDAWKAFNGTNSSATDTWCTANNTTTGTLSYMFASPKKIVAYSIAARNSADAGDDAPGASPKNWTFEGSNDGTSWTVLHTVTNSTGWAIAEIRTFAFGNGITASYKYYRINITSNNGKSSWTTIGELSMFEYVTTYKILILSNGAYMKYASAAWQTVTAVTPTENDYLVSGMDDISTIPLSAWQQLTGTVEFSCYTDDQAKTEAQFNIGTSNPFTLADEWADQTISVIEYTDNTTQTESAVTIETDPFNFYDEMGDTFDLLYYTEDTTKTAADLTINANYTPLDDITGDMEVVTWTPTELKNQSDEINYKALPMTQLVLNQSNLAYYGDIQSIIASKITTALPEGIMRFIISFDGGATWKSYKHKKWSVVDTNNLTTIRQKGMELSELNAIPTSELVSANKAVRLGYYIDEYTNKAQDTKISVVKAISKENLNDVKFSALSFYLLNTTATINVSFLGNKVNGQLSDDDAGKVRYRVLLNGNPYYPANGTFTQFVQAPTNININIDDRKVNFGVQNTVKVEFQDYWGQTDSWSTTFVGSYSGLMFTDETGNFYSTTFGEVLKKLDFGTLIAGQTSLDQKVLLKNVLGYDVQNIKIDAIQPPTSGSTIELSKTQSPFLESSSLTYPEVLLAGAQIEFYVRISTVLTATPTSSGTFEIKVNADKVV